MKEQLEELHKTSQVKNSRKEITVEKLNKLEKKYESFKQEQLTLSNLLNKHLSDLDSKYEEIDMFIEKESHDVPINKLEHNDKELTTEMKTQSKAYSYLVDLIQKLALNTKSIEEKLNEEVNKDAKEKIQIQNNLNEKKLKLKELTTSNLTVGDGVDSININKNSLNIPLNTNIYLGDFKISTNEIISLFKDFKEIQTKCKMNLSDCLIKTFDEKEFNSLLQKEITDIENRIK